MQKTLMNTTKKHITQITYKDLSINVIIRKIKLSKKISIKIDYKNNGVRVNIPYYMPYTKGLEFVNKKSFWIYEKLKKNNPIYILKNKHISLLGCKLSIHLIHSNATNNITLTNNSIVISANITNEEKIKYLLTNFIKKLLKNYVTEFIINITSRLKVSINKIFLKDCLNSWGSCSCLKNISINWRLVFAPKEVLNYIIYHEVAHLIHFNHSKQFWDLVEKLDPYYKKSSQWLKTYGYTLYQYKI